MNFQTQAKEYLDNNKIQLFESKIINMKINWWSLLKQILNVEKIIKEIKDYVQQIIDPNLMDRGLSTFKLVFNMTPTK